MDMRTAAPTIEQVMSEVARKRGEAVASTVDLSGKVNFSTLREKFIVPTWGRLIGVAMSDRAAGGAYIMAAYQGEAAVEECVGSTPRTVAGVNTGASDRTMAVESARATIRTASPLILGMYLRMAATAVATRNECSMLSWSMGTSMDMT